MIRCATFRLPNVQLSRLTFDIQWPACSYTPKQPSLSHTAFERGLWMHTCSNTYSFKTHSPWKNLAYYPYCIRVQTFLLSTAPPASVCVCVCVRGKQWIDREGVTHYSMGASILWHSTINKTPLVFDPLMWAGYPLPTDREAEGVKEQVQTIAISQEWCENVSLTTWTWISPRAGVQFCDHGNYYKLLHQSLQHPTERRRTPMSVTHSHVKWHRHAPERYADTDNMT